MRLSIFISVTFSIWCKDMQARDPTAGTMEGITKRCRFFVLHVTSADSADSADSIDNWYGSLLVLQLAGQRFPRLPGGKVRDRGKDRKWDFRVTVGGESQI